MTTVTKTYSAVDEVSTSLYVKRGDKISYVITGTFSATLALEKSENAGASWENELTFTAASSGTLTVSFEDGNGAYRVRCTSYTSGSPYLSLQSISLQTADTQTSVGVGSVPSVTGNIVAVEFGNGSVHKTVLHLNNVQVDVVSVTTGNGVGGTTIYDFPEGYISIIGATADLSIGVGTQADFTDGTPEGDVGLGTLAPANADALGTDATDDNICTSTAFTMSSYAATVDLPPDAATINIDGTSTAVNLVLTALVDAADIDDDTTGELLFTGTATVVWSNLGDY